MLLLPGDVSGTRSPVDFLRPLDLDLERLRTRFSMSLKDWRVLAKSWEILSMLSMSLLPPMTSPVSCLATRLAEAGGISSS